MDSVKPGWAGLALNFLFLMETPAAHWPVALPFFYNMACVCAFLVNRPLALMTRKAAGLMRLI